MTTLREEVEYQLRTVAAHYRNRGKFGGLADSAMIPNAIEKIMAKATPAPTQRHIYDDGTLMGLIATVGNTRADAVLNVDTYTHHGDAVDALERYLNTNYVRKEA